VQHNDKLGEIHIASRTLSKCQKIIDSLHEKKSLKQPGVISAHALNALDIEATKTLINSTRSQIVINVGASFVNMSVLQAWIDTGAAYIDTAIHEDPLKICETPPWYGNYEWKRRSLCADKHITAILGAGFDPGIVSRCRAGAR
jgi:saccharopine dehydrogenase-like NADP-dependent oxidoreductase